MAVLSNGTFNIDYTDDGAGQTVILIHSSASGNRQWRSLIELLKDRYRVIAVNLYGYGESTTWPGTSLQSLYAQAQLIVTLCKEIGASVHLVGHSFGGSVALKTAMLLDSRIESMTLLEPNPFYLLKQGGRTHAFLEAMALRDHVKCYGALGDWRKVAEFFADYWQGDGSWSAMPENRRSAFADALPPNFYEWDAVMGEETTVEELKSLNVRTMVVSDKATRRPIREIVDVLATACPHWSFRTISEGGHMAPLTRPELINPLVRAFLDEGSQQQS